MEKAKAVFFAAVVLAVMIVIALRGCPRRYHGRRSWNHRQGAEVRSATLHCRQSSQVRTGIKES
jgi:hypothetical protein